MIKRKQVTQKAIKAKYEIVIKVGNDNLQELLRCEQSPYYTIRREGWASDVYCFDLGEQGTYAISTGNQPFGDVEADYYLTRKYEERATEIRARFPNFAERKLKLFSLIVEFLHEMKQKYLKEQAEREQAEKEKEERRAKRRRKIVGTE